MAAVQTIRIKKDGTIQLPRSLMKEYDLEPLEEIRVVLDKQGLRIEKISADDPYDKFLKLLEDGLKGISWKEIEAEREDR